MDRIPVAGPWITQREIDYVTDAAANAWYSRAGEYNERFETLFAATVGRKYAVSLPSCTAGLHLALAALNIGPGDEVIVPDCTWIASAAPVDYVGATVVFADIDPLTWCLAPQAVEACLTSRTKAIIPVDLYGSMADYQALEPLCKSKGIALIEDAAESIGSTYRGKPAGSFGDVAAFSFHGSKTLTTGEGGMVVTDRDDLLQRIMIQRDHGRLPGDTLFKNAEVGFKYKMSAMQAALGLAQTERLNELILRKRLIFNWYRSRLADVEGLTLNAEPAGTLNSYWMVTVVLDQRFNLKKEELIAVLAAQQIDSRPFFSPLSSLGAYAARPQAAAARKRNSVCYAISGSAVNLPSGLQLTEAMVDRVCDSLRIILRNAQAGAKAR